MKTVKKINLFDMNWDEPLLHHSTSTVNIDVVTNLSKTEHAVVLMTSLFFSEDLMKETRPFHLIEVIPRPEPNKQKIILKICLPPITSNWRGRKLGSSSNYFNYRPHTDGPFRRRLPWPSSRVMLIKIRPYSAPVMLRNFQDAPKLHNNYYYCDTNCSVLRIISVIAPISFGSRVNFSRGDSPRIKYFTAILISCKIWQDCRQECDILAVSIERLGFQRRKWISPAIPLNAFLYCTSCSYLKEQSVTDGILNKKDDKIFSHQNYEFDEKVKEYFFRKISRKVKNT